MNATGSIDPPGVPQVSYEENKSLMWVFGDFENNPTSHIEVTLTLMDLGGPNEEDTTDDYILIGASK